MRQRLPDPVVGAQFGHWVVQSTDVIRENKMTKVYVSCPHETNVLVNWQNIRKGGSTGCKQCALSRLFPTSPESKREHYLLRARWKAICSRCMNPEYPTYEYYGARGISVCAAFKTFDVFKSYVKALPGYDLSLQLDRIDNMGDYEPGNLRWATRSENQQNKRDSLRVDYNGRSMSVREFQTHTTLSLVQLKRNLKQGKNPTSIVQRCLKKAMKIQ